MPKINKRRQELLNRDFLYEQFIVNCKTARQIAEEFNGEEGITVRQVEYYIDKYKIKRSDMNNGKRFKYPINESRIDKTNPIFCYFAGLVATDGYCDEKNSRVQLQITNEGSKEVLERIAEYFETKSPVKVRHNNRDKATGRKPRNELFLYSEVLLDYLEKEFNIPKGANTFTVGVPNEFHSEDCKRMYLRGVLDGDGNIHKNSGNFSLSKGSEAFVRGIVKLLSDTVGEEAVKAFTSTNGAGGEYPGVFISGRHNNKKFYDFVYSGYEGWYFYDKYNRYLDLHK